MRQDYQNWLAEQKYQEGTQTAQMHRVKKVEEAYGSLDEHFTKGTYDDVVADLQYSMRDEREKKPNTSKMKFDGNIRNNLQSYKNAVVRYRRFLNDSGFERRSSEDKEVLQNSDALNTTDDSKQQRFSLERDMQAALRLNITSLEPSLTIVDDGAERAVNSGFIDITCDDGATIVVVELKAGKADSRAIGQILGYMGDIQEEEEKPVRGILVANDFDKRARAAARVVPTLTLKKYSIEFKFTAED